MLVFERARKKKEEIANDETMERWKYGTDLEGAHNGGAAVDGQRRDGGNARVGEDEGAHGEDAAEDDALLDARQEAGHEGQEIHHVLREHHFVARAPEPLHAELHGDQEQQAPEEALGDVGHGGDRQEENQGLEKDDDHACQPALDLGAEVEDGLREDVAAGVAAERAADGVGDAHGVSSWS